MEVTRALARALTVVLGTMAVSYLASSLLFSRPKGSNPRDPSEVKVGWSQPIGTSTTDSPNATPTPANGVVFVGANDGSVRAFDAASGSPVWNSGPYAFAVYAAPIVANGRVIAGAWRGAANSDAGTIRAWTLGSSPSFAVNPTNLSFFRDRRRVRTRFPDGERHQPGFRDTHLHCVLRRLGAWRLTGERPDSDNPDGAADHDRDGGGTTEPSASTTLTTFPTSWTTGHTWSSSNLSATGLG